MLERYRMTDAEMAELRRCAPAVKWKHSRDGGADGRIHGILLWVTKENPYYDPRGGWMVQILVTDNEEARLVRASIARAVRSASCWLAAKAAPMLRASAAMMPTAGNQRCADCKKAEKEASKCKS